MNKSIQIKRKYAKNMYSYCYSLIKTKTSYICSSFMFNFPQKTNIDIEFIYHVDKSWLFISNKKHINKLYFICG